MLPNFITDHRQDTPPGKYQLLQKHLLARFADRLVLTFLQIEDLVGFPLPSQARTEPSWWDNADAAGQGTGQSEAWTRAGRSASVNMSAQCVVFERDGSAEAGH